MPDADLAATAAAQLARFAERVREAAGPAVGSSGDRVRTMLERAALVRQWATVRASLIATPPAADATLAERSRQLAERCRTSKGGWLGQWPTDLLGEAADRLTQLADRLDAAHVPTGLAATMTEAVAHLAADPFTAQLLSLDTTLAGLSDACRGLLPDLAAHPLGHVFDHFDAKLTACPPAARAAAGVVCVLLDRLTTRTADPHPWAFVRRWAEGWFAGSGMSGAVLLDEPPPEGVVAESFPLPTGVRVVLAVVQPGGLEATDDGRRAGADGSRLDWPAADSRPSDEPFDTILEVHPDGHVTLSDSPVSAAFAAFHQLCTVTADHPRWWAGGRWRNARRLCRTPDPAGVAALAGTWIDECSPTPSQFAVLCTWAEACGLTVTPADAPDTPGVTVRHVFASAPASTVVSGNRVGFSSGNEVFRPAVVEVSVGPLPAGFAELERAGERLPRGSELRKRVADLRTAAAGDYLREAVLGLYSDFWGEPGAAARDAVPDAAADVGDRLTALLADAFGLRPFAPVNVHDLPSGWVTVAPGSRLMTGVVSRVLRPGLQDDHGHLRIPAVVEVE